MPSGKYKVSAFEKNVNVSKPKDDATEEEKQRYRERIAMWENYPFVPGFTEENILEVREEVTTPVFYQDGEMLWISSSNKENKRSCKARRYYCHSAKRTKLRCSRHFGIANEGNRRCRP